MSEGRSFKKITGAMVTACLISPAWMLSGCQIENDEGTPVVIGEEADVNVNPTGTTGTNTSPTIVSLIPKKDARDVELGAPIQFIFSDDMLATTVTASTVSLLGPDGETVPLSFNFDGSRTLTLTTRSPLDALSQYQLRLSTDLSSQAGDLLETEYTSSFTTRDGLWLNSQPVEFDNSGAADRPAAAFDADGNVTVVWQQDDGTGNTNIWLNQFDLDSGWLTPTALENSAASAVDPKLVIDDVGNISVIWLQDEANGTQSLMYRTYDAEKKVWSATSELDKPTAGDVNDPAMDANSAGRGIIVWAQDDGDGVYSILARRSDKESGMAAIELLEQITGSASSPAAGMSEDGSAVVVWAQAEDNGDVGIWASRFDPDTVSWSDPQLIEARADEGSKPHVAVDAQGNAIAAWLQTDSSGTVNAWANRFEPETGWEQARLIESETGNADSPFVSVSDQGNFNIVWSQEDADGTSNIMANGYGADSGWETPELLENNTGDAFAPQVDLDGDGHGIAIWQQDDATGDSSIWVSRFVADLGWEDAETIESGNGDANSPYIVIDDEGNALAVWQQVDEEGTSIQASRFTMTPESAVDSTAPTVTTTEPLSGVTGVDPAITIKLEFSEAVQEGALSSSIMLLKSGETVPTSLSFDGSKGAVLAPAGSLDLGTIYRVLVSEGIRDLAGNPLSTEYSWTFTTREAVWGDVETVESNGGAAFFSDVAMNSDGGGLAVWTQSIDGLATQVWSNSYELGIGWGDAIRIDNSEHFAGEPTIRFDADGNATAVWLQDNGSFVFDVWANAYIAGEGWGTAQKIETVSGSASDPQLLITPDGLAVVTWIQGVGGDEVGVFVNTYDPEAGQWAVAERIDAGGETADDPYIAVDALGDRVVVWSQSDGSSNANIWSNRYIAGLGWTGARTIDSAGGESRDPRVTMDAEGNAVAIWRQDDGTGIYSVWSNRFEVGFGWGGAALLEESAGQADDIRIVSDAEGNALALWTQLNESGRYDIFMALYAADDGWQAPQLLETRDGIAYSTDIAVSDDGELVVVWHQKESEGIYNIWALRYSKDLGWGSPEIIEAGTGSARNPSVAINSQGVAVAVWIQEQGGIDSVFANEFK